MSLTEGLDYERCLQISDELKRLGGRLGDLGAEGSALMGTLVESWGGDDCERFFVDWTFTGRPQLERGSSDITTYAQDLRTQAVEQDLASEISGPLSATSTAKSPWDRAKDGLVDKMRGASKFMSDTVDKYPVLYLVPGGAGLAMKSGSDTVNSAANWIDDPKQAAEDWKNKPHLDQGIDVVSVIPVGRALGAAGRGLRGALKGRKAVNKAPDPHAPDSPKKPDHDSGDRGDPEKTENRAGMDNGRHEDKDGKADSDGKTNSPGKPVSEMSDDEVKDKLDGGLEAHEGGAHNGHAMERHVDKTDDQLIKRSNGEDPEFKKVPREGSSSYPDAATGNRTTAESIQQNQDEIDAWVKNGEGKRSLTLDTQHDHTTGRHVPKGSREANDVSGSHVVLIRDPSAPKGYRIGNSYPTP